MVPQPCSFSTKQKKSQRTCLGSIKLDLRKTKTFLLNDAWKTEINVIKKFAGKIFLQICLFGEETFTFHCISWRLQSFFCSFTFFRPPHPVTFHFRNCVKCLGHVSTSGSDRKVKAALLFPSYALRQSAKPPCKQTFICQVSQLSNKRCFLQNGTSFYSVFLFFFYFRRSLCPSKANILGQSLFNQPQ